MNDTCNQPYNAVNIYEYSNRNNKSYNINYIESVIYDNQKNLIKAKLSLVCKKCYFFRKKLCSFWDLANLWYICNGHNN